MRSKTKKSVSRLLGIWTFLVLLIFKGAFPKPAYAFLSSLDACAAQPECANAIASEVAPAVATPTASGVSATITSTTAAGATTASEAAAGVTVVGDLRLSGIAAYYLWSRGVNGQAQERAKQRYCAAYPSDSVCGQAFASWSDVNYTFQVAVPTEITSLSVKPSSFIRTGWSTPYSLNDNSVAIDDPDIPGRTLIWSFTGSLSQGVFTAVPSAYSTKSPNPGSFLGRIDFAFNGPIQEWKDWPQEKRSTAVASLTASDWLGLINSMPVGGVLIPGNQVNAPSGTIIPGQEEDDPNTPADERLLRKDDGFFTWPGLPDTDLDGDSVSDTDDPEPQNPNVPVASENPPEPSDPAPSPSEPTISERDVIHIFRDAPGHLPEDTPENRELLINTASNPDNYLGPDRYGTQWYAETRPDGTQVWVRIRNGQIVNGGVNPIPKSYNPETGLNDPPRQ